MLLTTLPMIFSTVCILALAPFAGYAALRFANRARSASTRAEAAVDASAMLMAGYTAIGGPISVLSQGTRLHDLLWNGAVGVLAVFLAAVAAQVFETYGEPIVDAIRNRLGL